MRPHSGGPADRDVLVARGAVRDHMVRLTVGRWCRRACPRGRRSRAWQPVLDRSPAARLSVPPSAANATRAARADMPSGRTRSRLARGKPCRVDGSTWLPEPLTHRFALGDIALPLGKPRHAHVTSRRPPTESSGRHDGVGIRVPRHVRAGCGERCDRSPRPRRDRCVTPPCGGRAASSPPGLRSCCEEPTAGHRAGHVACVGRRADLPRAAPCRLAAPAARRREQLAVRHRPGERRAARPARCARGARAACHGPGARLRRSVATDPRARVHAGRKLSGGARASLRARAGWPGASSTRRQPRAPAPCQAPDAARRPARR